MAFEKRELDEKTYKDFVERTEDIVEADVSLVPHTAYHANDSYMFRGLGELFDGVYRIKRVEHTITPESYDVNTSCVMTFNNVGTPAEDVKPGEKKGPEKAQTNSAKEVVHTVKSGESLWDICKKYCGKGSLFNTIASVNGIDDPSLIYPGDKIKIPGKYRK